MPTPSNTPSGKSELKSMPLDELLSTLVASRDGLSQDDAHRRLTQYGPNELAEKKTNPITILFGTVFAGSVFRIDDTASAAGGKWIREGVGDWV